MVLFFKKLRFLVVDDGVNYIYFEVDCIVYFKYGFDSIGILYFVIFFFFIL